MGYINAEEILPLEIIEIIQNYVDGQNIYIPRKNKNRSAWGSGTEIRSELRDRNQMIYREHLQGEKTSELARKYFLSEKSIQRIVREVKMKYKFSKEVKNNDKLRESFNELTRQTFGFDFVGWYEAGHWGDLYIPHVLLDGEKVVSNVSVNLMQFDVKGVKKNYIQLGTVMTDVSYRGQGLNSEIMKNILKEYTNKVDGIYLFANDNAVSYYLQFGFKPSKEYEYYMPCENRKDTVPYLIEKVDMTCPEQLYEVIRKCAKEEGILNQNDGMYMNENLFLYQFWLATGFGESVYFLPEMNAYIIAELEESTLRIHQIFGKEQVDIVRFAKTFGDAVNEVILGYTPVHKENFLVREYREEDCTLLILGEDLERIERDQMLFPVLSHA